MTVSSTSSRTVYQGNGSTTVFPFAFKVQQAADLVVVYTDATGTDFTLSPSQYAATGFGVDAGGAVTYPLSGAPIAAGATLTIYRDVAPTQPTSISNQGAMWPQVIEAALDRLTFIAQKITDTASRALVISPTDGGTLAALPAKGQRANSWLAFDGDGQPIAAQGVGPASVSSWLAANFLAMTSRLAALRALGGAGTADDNAFTGTNTFPTPPGGDTSQKAATTAFVRGYALRSYLAGLTLSAAGGTATFGVAAGCAADSTNVSMMTLGTAITKTTAAWAVGSGNGALDTGTIADNTWYHVYLTQRPDTGAVDVVFSTSASAPTLPPSYTLYRRVGSMKTDGAGKWVAFIQNGDKFLWMSPPNDVNGTVNTTSALYALSIPPGVMVQVIVRAEIQFGANALAIIHSPLQGTLSTTSQIGSLISVQGTSGNQSAGQFMIMTNVSQQIRAIGSSNGIAFFINTDGWFDRRGRDS
jgi:hypothetical protein